MIVKVPYIDKDDNNFYEIVQNETGFDSNYCYEIKEDLIYVNRKNKFDLKMPKLIKKLSESVPDDNFLILELVLDSIYVFLNNGKEDFEYQVYNNSPEPIFQLFASLLTNDEKFSIYYIENDELKTIIDGVVKNIKNLGTIEEDNLIPVDVTINNDDILDFFTKVSFEDKIKNKFKEFKEKLFKKFNKTSKSPKKQSSREVNPELKKAIFGMIIFLPIALYWTYDNGYLDGIISESPSEIPITIPIQKIDKKRLNLSVNLKNRNAIKSIFGTGFDLLELSGNDLTHISKLDEVKDMSNKVFIDNGLYIVEDKINTKSFKDKALKDFISIEKIDPSKFIEFRSENQLIMRVPKDDLLNVVDSILCNENIIYNVNMYRINNLYQVIFFSDNIIKDLSGEIEIKQTVKKDVGAFSKKEI